MLSGQGQIFHLAPGHDSVQIRGYFHTVAVQGIAGRSQNTSDDGPAPGGGRLGVALPVTGPAVGGEPHVIELDFIDPGPGQFPGQGQVVLRHFLPGGIDPDAAPLRPDRADGIPQGQVRSTPSQFTIEEQGDPGHHVQTALVETVHHVLQGGYDRRRTAGAPRGQRMPAVVGHATVDILGVEHDRIAARLDETIHPGQHGRDTASRARQVDAPHFRPIGHPVGHPAETRFLVDGNLQGLPDTQKIGFQTVDPTNRRQQVRQ